MSSSPSPAPDVTTIRPGQFVIGSFFASDNICEISRSGYQSSCMHREPIGGIGTQAEYARIPLADGTLVATPELPSDDLIPSFLAASDVLLCQYRSPNSVTVEFARRIITVTPRRVS